MKKLLFSIMLLVASHGDAYKFICNGVDAEGTTEDDHCGTCDDVTGPRWMPAAVSIKVDANTRPSGLSKDAWMAVAIGSMDSWNKVSGANIKIQHVGETVRRNFGSDSSNHELFWVNNKAEWRRKVGGGENGALGVTVSPYNCPNSARKSREIYDADLIMNAVGSFKWSPTCKNWGDCDSIRSTLTHELGHFIGLGHPCTSCSWSIMSAQASFNTEYPVFDDQQALRALYPGTSSGEIGVRCDNDADCGAGLSCVSQADAHYCSKACSDQDKCPDGYACDASTGSAVCRFAIGRLAGAVGLGESCKTQPCEDGLYCAGENNDYLFCYDMCSPTDKCKPTETCVTFEGGGKDGVCLTLSKLGERCDYKSYCAEKLTCVMDGDSGLCRKECDPKKRNQCPGGETCHDMGQGNGACLAGHSGGGGTSPSNPNTSVPGRVEGDSGTLPSPMTSCACLSASSRGVSNSVWAGLLLFGLLGVAFGRRRV
jgi:hypothetical protein